MVRALDNTGGPRLSQGGFGTALGEPSGIPCLPPPRPASKEYECQPFLTQRVMLGGPSNWGRQAGREGERKGEREGGRKELSATERSLTWFHWATRTNSNLNHPHPSTALVGAVKEEVKERKTDRLKEDSRSPPCAGLCWCAALGSVVGPLTHLERQRVASDPLLPLEV